MTILSYKNFTLQRIKNPDGSDSFTLVSDNKTIMTSKRASPLSRVLYGRYKKDQAKAAATKAVARIGKTGSQFRIRPCEYAPSFNFGS